MLKGIYNVHFAGLQFSAIKIIQRMCKISVHKNQIVQNSEKTAYKIPVVGKK